MAVQMTRQEYEQKYGVKPVFASTSVLDDEKPAPIQMTRAEYNALYYPEKQANPDGLGSKLVERGKDILNSGEAERTLTQPLRPELRAVGAVAGAGADVISAVVSPVISAARSFLAEKDITKKVASSKPVGNFLDITNKATDFATGAWKAFEEENPIIAQDIRDIANIASFLPGPKAIKPVVTKADDLIQASKASAAESGIKNVVDEISKIENKYVKTRNANNYEKDVDASRRRIAESNVLADAVDSDGVIRTKGIGGAIDQYKKQTIEGMEDIVKQNLDLNKEVMNFDDVRKALVREVGKSGLEGADLISALAKVDKEIAGLAVRTRGSSIIDLGVLHDAKIATTKNINYLTPPEKATYRKAIARAYKQVVEENSKKFDVKTANETLAKYYKDITRLERLDGARAEGGRLGKIGASIVGTGIGMAAGSTAGGIGAAVGGVIGGEAAQALKGAGMSRTFRGGGKGLAKDPVLVRAKLSIPDKPVKAKSTVPKTKEIKEVESQIAKNVADQKKAIKAGDFTLVAALKDVYAVLVDELKKLIASVKESAKNPTIGLSIKRTITPEQKLQIAKELEDYDTAPMTVNGRIDMSDTDTEFRLQQLKDKNAGGSFTDTDAIEARTLLERKGVSFEKKATTPTTLLEEAKKYKSAEEFVKAQPAIYHGTPNKFDKFDSEMTPGGSAWFSDNLDAVKNNRVEGSRPAGSQWNVMERYIKPDVKLVDRSTPEGKRMSDNLYSEQLESMGYKGIKHEADAERGSYIELFKPNEDTITRSQLTDIWKKANGTKP